MLIPSTTGRIQIVCGRVSVKRSRTRCKRVVGRLLFKLHTQHENFKRVHRMRK